MMRLSIHVLAGDYDKSKSKLASFDKFLDSSSSFFNMYRPKNGVSSSIVFNTHETRHIEPERGSREVRPLSQNFLRFPVADPLYPRSPTTTPSSTSSTSSRRRTPSGT